jgi:hypothetical protein
MEGERKEKTLSSSPKDKSLDSYKAWMIEIAKKYITPTSKLELTEWEWMEGWKEFWKKTHQSLHQH